MEIKEKDENLSIVNEISILYKKKILGKVEGSKTVFNYLKGIYENAMDIREMSVVMFLNRNHKIMGHYILSVGGLHGTVIDSKLIFGIALKTLTSYIIISHNHPSGNLKPSQQDDLLTQKIKKMGEILEIPLLDHLILTDEGYYSYADVGKL